MHNNFSDIDVMVDNSVELPKAAKAEDVIFDEKYKIKDVKFCMEDNILHIEGVLIASIYYKSVDHTIRWNEQIIPISATKIIDNINFLDINCECVNIRKIMGKILGPNVYTQQIYICFRANYNR